MKIAKEMLDIAARNAVLTSIEAGDPTIVVAETIRELVKMSKDLGVEVVFCESDRLCDLIKGSSEEPPIIRPIEAADDLISMSTLVPVLLEYISELKQKDTIVIPSPEVIEGVLNEISVLGWANSNAANAKIIHRALLKKMGENLT